MKYSKDESGASVRWNNWLKLPFFFRFLYKKGGEEECNNNGGVDRISELPDDILISIISKLSLQEAAAIPTLSTRWRHLLDTTTRLNFPPFLPQLGPSDEDIDEIYSERLPRYIERINQTLDSYKHGLQLKEFRVHMHSWEGATFERWLEFALSREVEVVDLQMQCASFEGVTYRAYFTLRLSELMTKEKHSILPGLRTLKELSLARIEVDDRDFHLLLSSSPLLESLSIVECSIKNVTIVGGSLKHLDISEAFQAESIELIDMMHLASLRLHGMPSSYVLKLDNVPKLTEFATKYSTLGNFLSGVPSSVHDQLRLLKLSTNTRNFHNFPIPELINVQHLELTVRVKGYPDLYLLFHIIEACPSLEKLEIKMEWLCFQTEFGSPVRCRNRTKTLSKNLKTLKLSGYLGWGDAAIQYASSAYRFDRKFDDITLGCENGEMEFISMVVENAEGLEEIVVEPCEKSHLHPSLIDEIDGDFLETAATRAWLQLRSITPLSVSLKVTGLSPSHNVLVFPRGIFRRISHVVVNFRTGVFRWLLRVLNRVYIWIFWSDWFRYLRRIYWSDQFNLRRIKQIGIMKTAKLLIQHFKEFRDARAMYY